MRPRNLGKSRVRHLTRLLSAVGVAVVLVAIAGCGGSSSTPQGPGAVALSFVHAASSGDASTMCDLTAQSELQKIKNLGLSCEAALTSAAAQLTANARSTASGAKVLSVSIHGDHASVILNNGASPGLVRYGGRWYVQTLQAGN